MGVSLHLKSLMDDRCTFGIQATDISIDKEGDLWEVELSEISGSETFIHLRSGEHTIVGLLEMVRDIQIGEKTSVQKEKEEVAETLGLANLLLKLTADQKQLSLLVVAWSKTM